MKRFVTVLACAAMLIGLGVSDGSARGGGRSGGSSGGSSDSSSAVQIAVPGKPGRTQTVLVSRPGTKTMVNKKEIPLTIRADITYLRQDFSILQPVVQSDDQVQAVFGSTV